MRKELCRFSNVTIKDGNLVCMNNVNLYIAESERVGIFGLHDSGKSLIAKAICNKLEVDGYVYYSELTRNGGFYISEESMLIPSLSVYENLFAINTVDKNKLFFNHRYALAKASDLLIGLNINLSPSMKVSSLDRVQNVIVQILKAYVNRAKLIVLDGITSTWNQDELTQLENLLVKLTEVTIVYICSKTDHIMLNCDRVAVTKSRKIVAVVNKPDINRQDLERYAFGQYKTQKYQKAQTEYSKSVLRISFGKVRIMV